MSLDEFHTRRPAPVFRCEKCDSTDIIIGIDPAADEASISADLLCKSCGHVERL